MLNAPLDFQESPRYALAEVDVSLRMKQVLLVDIRDARGGEMGRQDELRFNQRKQQTKHDNNADGLEERTCRAAHEHHRHECSNRG